MTELEPRRPDDGEDRLQGTSCRKVPFCKYAFAQKNVFFLRSSNQHVSRAQLDAVRTTKQRLCEGAAPIIDGILSGRLLDTCLTLEMHYNRVKFLRYELLVKGGQLG